jgi:hypothetical protein
MPGYFTFRENTRHFVPSHRKSRSLGSNVILSNLVKGGEGRPSGGHDMDRRRYSGDSEDGSNDSDCYFKQTYLIDDSLIKDSLSYSLPSNSSVLFDLRSGLVNFGFKTSEDYSEETDSGFTDMVPPGVGCGARQGSRGVTCEGFLKRKTLLKDGRKPTITTWVKFWVSLTGSVLLYYPSRSIRGSRREDEIL